jgi:hypothetical protein
MRKLATIQRIASLTPIKDADKIEKATILGWEVVVAKKDGFKVDDLCVYCEIDSILPDKPEFEFLRERKFRIKTIKLKGQVSQGICFPLSILPSSFKPQEGIDVTDLLGIKKYDPQAEFERKEADRLASINKNRMDKFLKRYAWYRKIIFKPTRKPFPAFIKKTDEDRIQLFPNYYENWKNIEFEVTEKIDGQSATYFVVPNPQKGLFRPKWLFGVCSRNFQLLKEDNSSYWSIARKHNIKNKMISWCEKHNTGLIIQGEIISDKIQGGKYRRGDYEFFVFNFIEYNHGLIEKFNNKEMDKACRLLGLATVPFICLRTPLPSMKEMVDLANGLSVVSFKTIREGLVWRNYLYDLSFKVVSPEFLLKYGE